MNVAMDRTDHNIAALLTDEVNMRKSTLPKM